jgi:3-deoxy-D-manno-octulosonic acid kinase
MPRLKLVALGPEVKIQDFDGGTILYDASRAGNATPEWLDPAWWGQRGEVRPAAGGRGAAVLIDADGRSLLLRHYRRGGLIARLSADRYVWQGAERTRSFQEWQLLYLMHRAGLPVPQPVAAGFRRNGYTYTADLLVQQIPGVLSLAEALRVGPLSLSVWVAIGRWLRLFHARGICHADLNAHNVLLGVQDGQVWLVDFDRGRLRTPGWWCDANLVRLQRSLQKIAAQQGAERFTAADWQALLQSYFSTALEYQRLQPQERAAQS